MIWELNYENLAPGRQHHKGNADGMEYSIMDEVSEAPTTCDQLEESVVKDDAENKRNQQEWICNVENVVEPIPSELNMEVNEKITEVINTKEEPSPSIPERANPPKDDTMQSAEMELITGDENPFLAFPEYPQMILNTTFLLSINDMLISDCMEAVMTFLREKCQIMCSFTYTPIKSLDGKKRIGWYAKLALSSKKDEIMISKKERYRSECKELLAKHLILLFSKHSSVIVTKKFTELKCRHICLKNITERRAGIKLNVSVKVLEKVDGFCWMNLEQHELWITKLEEETITYGINDEELPLISPATASYQTDHDFATIETEVIVEVLTPILNHYVNSNDLTDLIFLPEITMETKYNIEMLLKRKYESFLLPIRFRHEGQIFLGIRKYVKNDYVNSVLTGSVRETGPYVLLPPGELTDDHFGPRVMANFENHLYCFQPDPSYFFPVVPVSRGSYYGNTRLRVSKKMQDAQIKIGMPEPEPYHFPRPTNYTWFTNYPPEIGCNPVTVPSKELSFLVNCSIVIENRHYDDLHEPLLEFGLRYKVPFNISVNRNEEDGNIWVSKVEVSKQDQMVEVATATALSKEEALTNVCKTAFTYLSTICNIIIIRMTPIGKKRQIEMRDLTGAVFQRFHESTGKRVLHNGKSMNQFKPTPQMMKRVQGIFTKYMNSKKNLDDFLFSPCISTSNLQFIVANAFSDLNLRESLSVFSFRREGSTYMALRRRIHPRDLTDKLKKEYHSLGHQYKLYKPNTVDVSFMWRRGDEMVNAVPTSDRKLFEHATKYTKAADAAGGGKSAAPEQKRKHPKAAPPNDNVGHDSVGGGQSAASRKKKRQKERKRLLKAAPPSDNVSHDSVGGGYSNDTSSQKPFQHSHPNPYKYYRNPVPPKVSTADAVPYGAGGGRTAVPFGISERVPFTGKTYQNRQPLRRRYNSRWDDQSGAEGGLDDQFLGASQSFGGAAKRMADDNDASFGSAAKRMWHENASFGGNSERRPDTGNKYGMSYVSGNESGLVDFGGSNQQDGWKAAESNVGECPQNSVRSDNSAHHYVSAYDRNSGGGSFGCDDRHSGASFGSDDRHVDGSFGGGNRGYNSSRGADDRNGSRDFGNGGRWRRESNVSPEQTRQQNSYSSGWQNTTQPHYGTRAPTTIPESYPPTSLSIWGRQSMPPSNSHQIQASSKPGQQGNPPREHSSSMYRYSIEDWRR